MTMVLVGMGQTKTRIIYLILSVFQLWHASAFFVVAQDTGMVQEVLPEIEIVEENETEEFVIHVPPLENESNAEETLNDETLDEKIDEEKDTIVDNEVYETTSPGEEMDDSSSNNPLLEEVAEDNSSGEKSLEEITHDTGEDELIEEVTIYDTDDASLEEQSIVEGTGSNILTDIASSTSLSNAGTQQDEPIITLYDTEEGEELVVEDQNNNHKTIEEITIYDAEEGEEVVVSTVSSSEEEISNQQPENIVLPEKAMLILAGDLMLQPKTENTDVTRVSSIAANRLHPTARLKDKTVITSMIQHEITIDQISIRPIDISPSSRPNALAGVKLGPDDDHLTFSHPVEIRIPIDATYNGQEIPVWVQHAGDTKFGTEGITTDPNASCDEGISSNENNYILIENGQAIFWTCGASTFILDPDNDGTNELTLWLKADAGTSCTTSGCSLASWDDQSGNSVFVGNQPKQTTVANQPTFLTNAQNFNPTVSFNSGANSFFATLSNISTNSLIGPTRSTGVYYLVFNASTAEALQHGTRIHIRNNQARLGSNTNINYGQTITTPTQILAFNRNGSAYTTYINGLQTGVGTNATVQNNQNKALRIGRIDTTYFGGEITEVLIYNESHATAQREGIESYLALKYSITLDSSISNYYNTDGGSVYTIDATYTNDIAGIARDDASTLDQRVAKSSNTTAELTVATDNDFTSVNGGSRTQLNDKQYFVWGHNGGAVGTTQTSDLDTSIYSGRIIREWKAEHTGGISNLIDMQFTNLASLTGYQKYVLLSDLDGDFSSGSSALDTGVDGIFENLNFSGDTSYFTIAIIEASNKPYLEVTKTDNDADNTVLGGQIIEYTIDITNDVLGTGSNISLTDDIDTNFGDPYNIIYSGCTSPISSFSGGTLMITGITVVPLSTCTITYNLQVDVGVSGGEILDNSVDVSQASEGGNDPLPVSADTLTVLDCSTNDVYFIFETDNKGRETFRSLVPSGDSCGATSEITSGGNTTQLDCTSGGNPRQSSVGNGYPNNSTITEGPYVLPVGSGYDLHIIDDANDGITTTDPDVRIQQNGTDTNTGGVTSPSTIISFTVELRTACLDTIQPNVTINQAISQTDPTVLDSATYTIVFDEAINTATFASGDISLTGTVGSITSGPTEIAPNNSTTFEITISGMSGGDTVIATIASGGIEDLVGNTNSGSTSIDNQITYSPITSTGNVSILAATGFSFSGIIQSENYSYQVEQQFTGYFEVIDGLGADSGYYTTLQISDFSGVTWGDTISNTNLERYATGITLLSGDVNTNVVLATGWSAYRTADSIYTFIKRDSGPNSNKTGTYGTLPWLRLLIPPYMRADTYQATMTYTLYE